MTVPVLRRTFRWTPTRVLQHNGHVKLVWLDYAWRVDYIKDSRLRHSPWLADERMAKGYLFHIRIRLRREAQRQ